MYKRILVPLDGSELAEQVLPYVRLLGTGFGAQVDLLHLVDPAPPGKPDLNLAGEARDYMERLATSLRSEGLEACPDVDEGDAAHCIVAKAEEQPGTLIAMSTHGRSGITRWLLGSVTDKVLRATTNPLLVIRSQTRDASPTDVRLKTIILPLDGSPLAEQILPHAAVFANTLKLEVILVKVVTSPDRYYYDAEFPSIPIEESYAQMDEEATAYLRQVGERLSDEGIPAVDNRLLRGHPAPAIVDLAREMPDSLVAMTTHGRSGLRRWALGSVADTVVQRSGAPVLVVRAKKEDVLEGEESHDSEPFVRRFQ